MMFKKALKLLSIHFLVIIVTLIVISGVFALLSSPQ